MNPPQPAAFSFQLSPEPPPVTARDPFSPESGEDAIDAAWSAAPDPAAAPSTSEEPASDALADALTEAPTQTPPPARALPLTVRAVPRPAAKTSEKPVQVQGRAPTLPRPIPIDEHVSEPPQLMTPTSGHQISQLLTAPSDEPAPVVSESAAVRGSERLPATKPLSFPSDGKRRASPPPDRAVAPVPERSVSPAPAHAESPAPERSVSPAPARAESPVPERSESPAPERSPAPAAASKSEPEAKPQPGVPEDASSAAAVEAPREQAAAVKDTSTFKVIGYALVAMAFSYIGMSALVAWLSDSSPDSAPVATNAQAADTDVEATPEADSEAAPPAAQDPKPEAPKVAKSEPVAKDQVAMEDMPVPAGLAIGADKGVLKVVTPDAHSLYVDGEFAGRGPVRIVPLPPGKHVIKTRFDGEEKTYEANVQAGRMTRLTISKAK